MIKMILIAIALFTLVWSSVFAYPILSGPEMTEQPYQPLETNETILFQSDSGTIKINFDNFHDPSLRVIIAKDQDAYIYRIHTQTAEFPLQMGSGTYIITILGSQDSQTYAPLYSQEMTVAIVENRVFLSPSLVVAWELTSDVVLLTQGVIGSASTDWEKLTAIHAYIVTNITYDDLLAEKVTKEYVPNPDATLENGMGICYDFAALAASMLRVAQIPTKLVMGYTVPPTVYHAWNEVYIDQEWIIIDMTTDAIQKSFQHGVTIQKNAEAYTPGRYY